MKVLAAFAAAWIVCCSVHSLSSADESTPPARTSLDHYGDPLPAAAATRMGTVRLRHESSVKCVAYSPDGRFVASAGFDRPIRFWDAATGRPVKQLIASGAGGAYTLAFSPDGETLASGSERGFVRLWDVETATEIWSQPNNVRLRVYGVAFAPNGQALATAASDGWVRVWNVATGKQLLALPTINPAMHSSFGFAFSPNGSLLAYGSWKDIQLYDFNSGETRVVKDALGGQIFSLAFTSDGRHLASGGTSASTKSTDDLGNEINITYAETKLWNVVDGTFAREFLNKERDTGNSTITLSKDGKLLASLHEDRIRLWDVSSGQLVRTIEDYHNTSWPTMNSTAISPDQRSIAAVGPEHAVMVWDLETGQRRFRFSKSHESFVRSVVCSPDGTLVASGADDGSVRLWNKQSGTLIRSLELAPDRIGEVLFSADGALIAAGGYDWKDNGRTGLIKVWRVSDGKSVWTERVEGQVTCLASSPDGNQLAAVSLFRSDVRNPYVSSLFIWATATGERHQSWHGPNSRIRRMSFSSDGSALILVGDKFTSTWDVATQKEVASFPTEIDRRAIRSAAFSADRSTVVTNSQFSDQLVWWDIQSGRERRRVKVESTKGSNIAISPNGAILACSQTGLMLSTRRPDRSIHFWNAFTGEHLGQIAPGPDSISALTFSADGHQLISGMYNGTLLVWNVLDAIE